MDKKEIEEIIKIYFDEKEKREKPKDKTQSYSMIFTMGAIGLYFIYLAAKFFNNF